MIKDILGMWNIGYIFCPNYSFNFFFSIGRIMVHDKTRNRTSSCHHTFLWLKTCRRLKCFFDTIQCGTNYFYVRLHASGLTLHSCHYNSVNHEKNKKGRKVCFQQLALWAKQSCLLVESWLTCSLASSITALLLKPSSHTHPPIHSQL